MAKSPCLRSIDLDGLRLVAFGSRRENHQEAVAIVRLDAGRVYMNRHDDGAVEGAGESLAPMRAGALVIKNDLLARNSDRVVLRLELEVALVDPRQFDDRHEVMALLEDVDRRKTAKSGRPASHPVALSPRVERPLNGKQRFERITERSQHRSLPPRKVASIMSSKLRRPLAR